MHSTDFDRIIAQEQKVLDSVNQHGTRLQSEFKSVTTLYVRDWAIKLLRSYFQDKPGIASGLGPGLTEELKQEFQDILTALPENVSKRLDDNQIWLHRVNIPDHALSDMTYSYQLEKRFLKYLNRAIRDLIGPVGSLVIKYGFVEIGTDYEWENAGGENPRYAYDLPSRGMDHFKDLDKLMKGYKNILVEYVYAVQNLRKAEQARKQAGGG